MRPEQNATAPTWLAALTVMVMLVYGDSLAHLGFSVAAIATVAAVAVAALLAGIAGFAFSAICGAIVFQFRHDTVDVVQTMLICSIANQTMCVWVLRRAIRWEALWPFLLGGCIGVPTGVWLLLHFASGMYLRGLGAVLLAYGGYMLMRPPLYAPRPTLAGNVAFGFLGGMTGGFAASPGAPVSIRCGMLGWDRARQRAVFPPFTLLMQFVALACISAMRSHDAFNVAIPAITWACVPAGLIGTWWGLECCRRITDWQFTKVLNLVLIASGASLVL
jgi:uncharacterized membrane protein YfcA